MDYITKPLITRVISVQVNRKQTLLPCKSCWVFSWSGLLELSRKTSIDIRVSGQGLPCFEGRKLLHKTE